MICYICRENKEADEFTNYIPESCCDGYQCGCMGLPINPPICDTCCDNIPRDEIGR